MVACKERKDVIMTKDMFWEELGWTFECMGFPCRRCIVEDRTLCSESCAEALKITYNKCTEGKEYAKMETP